MEQRLLLVGSIVAVVVLVLAGLSPVVSYYTNNSSAIGSPLFQVRTSRAIDEESKTITGNYLRQDNKLNFIFPNGDNPKINYQKVIKSIITMEDEEFKMYTDLLIQNLINDDRIKEDRLLSIIGILNELRKNGKTTFFNDYIDEKPEEITSLVTICQWEPGCFINILLRIYDLLLFLFLVIIGTITLKFECVTTGEQCNPCQYHSPATI